MTSSKSILVVLFVGCVSITFTTSQSADTLFATASARYARGGITQEQDGVFGVDLLDDDSTGVHRVQVMDPPIGMAAIANSHGSFNSLGVAAAWDGSTIELNPNPNVAPFHQPFGSADLTFRELINVTSSTLADGTPVDIMFSLHTSLNIAAAHTIADGGNDHFAFAGASIASNTQSNIGLTQDMKFFPASQNRAVINTGVGANLAQGLLAAPFHEDFIFRTVVGDQISFSITLDADANGSMARTVGPNPGDLLTNHAGDALASIGIAYGATPQDSNVILLIEGTGIAFPAASLANAANAQNATPANPVPEPTSAALFVAVLVVLCCRRTATLRSRASSTRVSSVLVMLVVAFFVVPLSPAAAQGGTEIIAQGGFLGGDPAPDGNGLFSGFGVPVLNNAGQAAFSAALNFTSGGGNDNSGVFRGDGNSITQIARENPAGLFDTGLSNLGEPALNDAGEAAFTATFQQSSVGGAGLFDGVFRGSGGTLTTIALEGNAAPDNNGTFLSFSLPALNASGQAAFHGNLTGTIFGASDDTGIFRGAGGPITQMVRERQAAPDLNGTFSLFSSAALNSSGETAFFAALAATSGGANDNNGIFRADGSTITQIARKGQAAPGGIGAFSDFGSPALNDSGRVAFIASVGITNAIYLSAGGPIVVGGPLTEIVREGQGAPDGNGTFSDFGGVALNDSGQVAFNAVLDTGSVTDNTGLFLGASARPVIQFARADQTAPDGNGAFSVFGPFAINALGQVAFHSLLMETSGGTTDDSGIFLANGIDILQVAREGDVLGGSTITGLSLNDSSVSNGDERSGLNDSSQVAYRAHLAGGDQVIVRFTIPDVHWTATNNGNWATAANWTPTTVPNSFHHTFIDPDEGLIVTGNSSDSIVRSLTVGATGSGQAVLELDNGGDLEGLESITINTRGRIEVGAGRVLTAPIVTNSGELIGDGDVNAALVNLPTGQVRARPGETLRIIASNAHSSAGMVEALSGAEIEFNGELTNAAPTGVILGTNATLRFNGGLINAGAASLTLGSELYGVVLNSPGGSITVENSISETTFARIHDDVTNAGTLDVTAGSTAVFIGALSGNGNVGGGDVQALGDLRPGASAGLMQFGGGLTLGPLTESEIELGGLTAGSEFDRLEVTGEVALAGILQVFLINGFMPALGDNYEVLSFGSRTGDFNGYSNLTLPGHLALRPTFAATSLLLKTRPAIDGDINLDGVVDIFDVNEVSEHWGEMGPAGDANGDGIVDIFDVNLISANWGATGSAGGSEFGANAVPEPSAWLLVVIGLAVGVAVGRPRRGPIR